MLRATPALDALCELAHDDAVVYLPCWRWYFFPGPVRALHLKDGVGPGQPALGLPRVRRAAARETCFGRHASVGAFVCRSRHFACVTDDISKIFDLS